MRYFYDCEFHEDGTTIDLLSIAIVPEGDNGAVYYAVNADADWERAESNEWLRDNVLTHISALPRTSKKDIADQVSAFLLLGGDDVELWADYAAYDHVCLAQLFGTMMSLPSHIPMFTNDFQQELRRLDIDQSMLPKLDTAHDALGDAMVLKMQFDIVQEIERDMYVNDAVIENKLAIPVSEGWL